VMTAWGIFDNPIILPNRSRIHREEAFLIYCARMHDYRKLSSFEREFGIEYTQLSRIFKHCSIQMSQRHFHLLFDNLNFWQPRFEMYNRKINDKHLELFHVPLPVNLQYISGFEDGTRLHVILYIIYLLFIITL